MLSLPLWLVAYAWMSQDGRWRTFFPLGCRGGRRWSCRCCGLVSGRGWACGSGKCSGSGRSLGCFLDYFHLVHQPPSSLYVWGSPPASPDPYEYGLRTASRPAGLLMPGSPEPLISCSSLCGKVSNSSCPIRRGRDCCDVEHPIYPAHAKGILLLLRRRGGHSLPAARPCPLSHFEGLLCCGRARDNLHVDLLTRRVRAYPRHVLRRARQAHVALGDGKLFARGLDSLLFRQLIVACRIEGTFLLPSACQRHVRQRLWAGRQRPRVLLRSRAAFGVVRLPSR